MMRIVFAVISFLALTPSAYSACTNYSNLKINATANEIIGGELDRLICLHNEQSALINQQAIAIREQQGAIADLKFQVDTLEQEVSNLRQK